MRLAMKPTCVEVVRKGRGEEEEEGKEVRGKGSFFFRLSLARGLKERKKSDLNSLSLSLLSLSLLDPALSHSPPSPGSNSPIPIPGSQKNIKGTNSLRRRRARRGCPRGRRPRERGEEREQRKEEKKSTHRRRRFRRQRRPFLPRRPPAAQGRQGVPGHGIWPRESACVPCEGTRGAGRPCRRAAARRG